MGLGMVNILLTGLILFSYGNISPKPSHGKTRRDALPLSKSVACAWPLPNQDITPNAVLQLYLPRSQ